MVEAKFLLKLLVTLLAYSTGLDRTRQVAPHRVWRQVRQIVFALAGGAPFAHQPDLRARQTPVVGPGWLIGRESELEVR